MNMRIILRIFIDEGVGGFKRYYLLLEAVAKHTSTALLAHSQMLSTSMYASAFVRKSLACAPEGYSCIFYYSGYFMVSS